MARVRLTVDNLRLIHRHLGAPPEQPRGIPFFRPGDLSGATAYIPWYRLVVRLVIVPRGEDTRVRPTPREDGLELDAVLDTGAPTCVFPFPIWQPFGNEIQWLDQPPREDGRPWAVTVLGGSWGYRLGRVRVGATDRDANWLPAATTNALFLNDPPATLGATRPPRQAILGVRSGLFDLRQLRHADADPPEWILEDA